MSVESTTTIAGLNALWPLGSDSKSEGDDHLRLIKSVLKTEFSSGGVKKTAEARNRIVNGAMQVSQENGYTASATSTGLGYYPADQWFVVTSHAPGTITAQRVQSWTANGSISRIRLTVGTAKAALAAGDYVQMLQYIEGVRTVDFMYAGTGARQSVLRFGFKAPAGTYSIYLQNSAGNRSYVANFTIGAGQANTDTTQTLIIPGDTTGTWLIDTGKGIALAVIVAAGSSAIGVSGWQGGSFIGTASNTNGLATAGNVFELFDVGLYLDPDATGIAPKWQMPDEAQELQACQRYWQQCPGMFSGSVTTTNAYYSYGRMSVQPRVTPSWSGVNVGAVTGFPAAVGALSSFNTIDNIRETRTSNATVPAALYQTTYIASARM